MSFKFSNVILSVLVVTMVTIGMFNFIGELGSNDIYDKKLKNDGLQAQLNQTQKLSNEINASTTNLLNQTLDPGAFLSLPVAIFDVVTTMITVPYEATSIMLNAIVNTFSLPTWVSAFLMGVVGVVFFVIIITLALRYGRTV